MRDGTTRGVTLRTNLQLVEEKWGKMVRSSPGSGTAWALKSDLDALRQTLPAI